ncbi:MULTISPECIES: sorbosone dehydrogenase family protein [Rhodomicrobium]|uniref:PQQ-dependent sugar dehydrogenase n=1 Tax=Rhodomicrobium TaxID=1068 RepID=UPI000B4AD2A2|nr:MULTISPECIES: sorbosone dehydrogenase family protein [Rhodomicrobium]
MTPTPRLLIPLCLALSLGACEEAKLPVVAGQGPAPQLPDPNPTTIPTVNIATAKGWQEGVKPQPANGLAVEAFAENLDHPRWLYVLPNGDVLVAETNGPKKEATGLRAWAMEIVMGWAGAGVPSANRITLLRDADGDGVAELKTPFIEGLNSPFGMVLLGDQLYVANADAVVRFPYKDGDTQITEPGAKVADLPGGPINHHWTKSLIASRDGSRLYAGVGSNSNVGENGMEAEERRAAILEIDPANGQTRVFASGLRNPVGMALQPESGALWVAVNERDEIGSDLVPDYMTSVKEGGFYGWPYSYYGQHVDSRVQPPKPELVAEAIVPDYALGPHTASLGLTFASGELLPEEYRNGAFVGQHGSWNRRPHSGYKVIFVPFRDGKPSGDPKDVLTGFLSPDGEDAYGRPVGVVIDKAGALLVADDVGDKVWRVSPSGTPRTTAASDLPQPEPVAAR